MSIFCKNNASGSSHFIHFLLNNYSHKVSLSESYSSSMASQLKFYYGLNLLGALWNAMDGLISDYLIFSTILS